MNAEIIERLELKLAFLERANQDLSDVVYRQQQEIDALRLRLEHLADRMQSMRDEPTAYTAEDEKPPHY